MIKTVNLNVVNNQYINEQNLQNGVLKPSFVDTHNTELSNYEVGQAILNRNNISFRNLATPIDVTDKYNKKTEGKDHLDLPNIHVYEYPDTNLQVIFDENQNIPKGVNLLEARLFFSKSQTNNSPLKDKIIYNILQEQLNKKLDDVQLQENNSGMFTVHTKTNEINNISNINQIINNLELSNEELINAKKSLIKEIESNKFKSFAQDFLIIDTNAKLKNTNELIKDIDNITLPELKQYYKNSIANTEAQYFLTVNAKDINKKELLKDINSDINNKYIKHSDKEPIQKYFYNDKLKIIKNNNIGISNGNIIAMYPYEEKVFKDNLTAFFTDLILVFLFQPCIQEESGPEALHPPISLNKNDKKYVYHNLSFNLSEAEFINSTPQKALEIQKNLFKTINDTDIEFNLKNIKKYFKESLNRDTNLQYKENDTNFDLYDYGYNIFQIYEIIDAIDVDDIKKHIQKYLIEQLPIMKMNIQG